MKKSAIFIFTILITAHLTAQIDSTLLKNVNADTGQTSSMNMDAIYDRPLNQIGHAPIALGGYMEADYQYMGENGISEGHTFRIPRMTIFIASSISRRLNFLSEIELEEGGRELALEFAALDVNLHPLLNFRGGVIMNPIGAFNQNHDSPKWEFVDRPIAMTRLLPATWSNVGFGIYGKKYKHDWSFGYEVYLSNGFDGTIIDNSENKTFLPASKENGERFEESSNGKPLLTTKISVRNDQIGEIGFSYMGGVYNTFEEDGLVLGKERRLDVIAIDFNTVLPHLAMNIIAEWTWIIVDVPETYSQQYGNRQMGGFVDFVQPLFTGRIMGFENIAVNLVCRLEYVDWNLGTFNETGGPISDDLWAIVPGIAFRPSSQSVLRFNYRYMSQQDLLGNPPSRISGLQIGIASYF